MFSNFALLSLLSAPPLFAFTATPQLTVGRTRLSLSSPASVVELDTIVGEPSPSSPESNTSAPDSSDVNSISLETSQAPNMKVIMPYVDDILLGMLNLPIANRLRTVGADMIPRTTQSHFRSSNGQQNWMVRTLGTLALTRLDLRRSTTYIPCKSLNFATPG